MEVRLADRQELQRRLSELVAAYNRQDADAVVALFRRDGMFVDIDGRVHVGRGEILADHQVRFARSPGSWFEVQLVSIDDLVATAMWRRHRAGDSSGNHDSWQGVDIIRFEPDGLIAVKTTFAKTSTPINERVPDVARPG